jgi:pimeloyl-ACP methyl ester carboxylesterase
MTLRMIGGGRGGPLLVLLHGLGASADVWHGVAEHWDGRWLAPDLPGHGGSDPLRRYSFGAMTAAVAAELGDDEPVVVLGHSLGGVLALTLATGWFGVPVSAAIGLGIKVRWTTEELAKAAELSARPARAFADRDEAVARALRVAGLASPDAMKSLESVDALVRQESDGWRPALDPLAFAVGAPDLPGLLATRRADVLLAAGERDPMCPEVHLAELSAPHTILAGLGHNAHVEDPAAVARLLPRTAASDG